MAQARRVPIPIRARITGAGLTTSTKYIRSAYDAPAAGMPRYKSGSIKPFASSRQRRPAHIGAPFQSVSRRVP